MRGSPGVQFPRPSCQFSEDLLTALALLALKLCQASMIRTNANGGKAQNGGRLVRNNVEASDQFHSVQVDIILNELRGQRRGKCARQSRTHVPRQSMHRTFRKNMLFGWLSGGSLTSHSTARAPY
jgi:hypothetical protein